MKPRTLVLLVLVAVVVALEVRGCREERSRAPAAASSDRTESAEAASGAARLLIVEVMADPAAVPDDAGEWVEVLNAGDAPADLRGWTLASGSDAPHVVARSVVVEPGVRAVLARDGDPSANGGARAAYAYDGLALANSSDWLALRDPRGRTVDSVAWRGGSRGASRERMGFADAADADGPAWRRAAATFGAGDRGTPGGGDVLAGVPEAPDATVRDATAVDSVAEPAAAVYRDHLAFGLPTDADLSDDHLLRRRQYVLSYNPRLGVANWVAWNLNRTHFGDAPRSPSFVADPDLPASMTPVVASDYTRSGYSRGHVVRSEERTATPEDNEATFRMTNVLPQRQGLNGGPWLDLERHLQHLAEDEGRELYLLAGGVFAVPPETLRGEGKVAVPASVWKVAVVLPSGAGLSSVRAAADLDVIAVLMPNRDDVSDRPWTEFATTVDAIEAATGYDLLDRLPDEVEREVEAVR